MATSGESGAWPLSGGLAALGHAVTVCRASGSADLVERTLAAALDVTGLSAAASVNHDGAGTVVYAGDERLAMVLAAGATVPAPPACGDPGHEWTVARMPFGRGVLLVGDCAPGRLGPAQRTSLELVMAIAETSLDRLLTLHELREYADADPLTGLGHLRPFGRRLAGAVPGRTAVLAIDVDDFKLVNDTCGHAAGDELLINLVEALQSALRVQDELYRVGGDEFAAVVEVERADVAWSIAERLVAAARTVGRTISVGVAVAEPGEPPEETMRRADGALYEAKRTGRDRVHRAA